MSALEALAESYWNAFRRGFGRVGGDIKAYPTWKAGHDPNTLAVQQETLRCLRHAAEALKPYWGKPFEEVFPEPPEERRLPRTKNDDAMAGKLK
ncbi:hypothetical protein [Rhizobium sp. BK251]|uniref:hypothetical protein n=1 Tax=Rhizobium sp. BK251 TaxID=2512125 RepID=UPI00104689F8|nr:hypothetical protein [Rhizobium sp. BK251]TCL70544.1 hypothetical protein EV286_107419 [Rhizobium sp. BK251]